MLAAASRGRHVVATLLPRGGALTHPQALCTRSFTACARRSLQDSASSESLVSDPLSKERLPHYKNAIFTSASLDPFINLAIETHLLTHSSPSSQILFFYRNRPCVVIGRNQNPWVECDLKKLGEGLNIGHSGTDGGATSEIDLVRRRSGGGTVFHDQGNLNYSVIVPNDSHFNRARYPGLIVRALRSMDHQLDVKVNERNDIVLQRDGQWLKVSGSAYKITRGRAMAHGTLLFGSSSLTSISGLLNSPVKTHIKAKGVESVRSPVGNLYTNTMNSIEVKDLATSIMEHIKRVWLQDFPVEKASSFQGDLSVHHETSELENNIQELKSDQWRFHQTPTFDVTIDGTDAGGVELKFEVQNGAFRGVHSKYVKRPVDDSSQSLLQAHLSTALQGTPVLIHDWDLQLRENLDESKLEIPRALSAQLSALFPPVKRFDTSQMLSSTPSRAVNKGNLGHLRETGMREVEV